MLDLTLDTSTDPHFLLLSEGEKVLDSIFFPHSNNLSASFVPAIEDLLKKNNCRLEDLSHIFVGVGPGSYTGTRVAVTVASCLALALNIPLYPFCSLLAFLPKNLPSGPFTYLVCSNNSPNFLLRGSLEENRILPSITNELAEEKDLLSKISPLSSLICTGNEKPSKNGHFPVFQKEINLPLLLTYLVKLKNAPPLPASIHYLHQF